MFLTKQIIMLGKILITFSFVVTLLLFLLLFFQKLSIKNSYYVIKDYKYFYVCLTVLISLVYMFIGFKFFFSCYNNFFIIMIDDKFTLTTLNNTNIVFELFKSLDFYPFRRFFIFSISKFNIIFILLFICLYPVISFMVISDDNAYSFKYYIHMQLIFCFSFFYY